MSKAAMAVSTNKVRKTGTTSPARSSRRKRSCAPEKRTRRQRGARQAGKGRQLSVAKAKPARRDPGSSKRQEHRKAAGVPQDHESPAPFGTDVANADLLAKRHGQDLKYTQELGWLVWNGTHWEKESELRARELAKEVARAYYRLARGQADEDKQAALAKVAKSMSSAYRIRNTVEMAKSIPAIYARAEDFDRNPWLLNAANGTLDLKTGQLRGHRREDLITRCIPVRYDPKAKCPQWEKFLDRVMAGDKELIGFVQRAIGYGLTGSAQEQVLFILHGSGANGKTVFTTMIQEILGPYAMRVSPESLMVRRNEGANPDIARLAGARMAFAAENDAGRRLSESLIKQATGGEKLVARHLYKETFEFPPEFKLWLVTNHLPEIQGTDPAIWRRPLVIPFTVRIPPEEQDRQLVEKLRAEFPGILAWAVRGCYEWQEMGLRPPEAVRLRTEEYRQDQDRLIDFLQDRCVEGDQYTCTVGKLYEEYKDWCEENNVRPFSSKRLGGLLRERGFLQKRSSKERYWKGLGLKYQTRSVETIRALRAEGSRVARPA